MKRPTPRTKIHNRAIEAAAKRAEAFAANALALVPETNAQGALRAEVAASTGQVIAILIRSMKW